MPRERFESLAGGERDKEDEQIALDDKDRFRPFGNVRGLRLLGVRRRAEASPMAGK